MYFGLLGKTGMFVLVKLFDSSIEHGTQAVGHISTTLGKPNSWLVALCMGGIHPHALCIVGVILDEGCGFMSAWMMLLSRNRSSLSHSCRSVCLMCWRWAFFLLPEVLCWAWGYDSFVIVDLLCWAECIVVSGGVRLGEYGKCIMHFGVGFGIE